MFKNLPRIEQNAAGKAEAIVRGWAAKPAQWSTHRAINKYRGTYRQKALGEREERLHQWNEDL